MPQEPLSSATTLCGVAEFLKRCDERSVAELVSDTNTPVDVSSLATDVNLAAALLDATGEVEAAAMHGCRYRPDDLAALTGAAQGRLQRLIARLALVYLYERRPDRGPIPEVYKAVLDQLEQLRGGEMIFGTTETVAASVQDHEVETSAVVESRNGTTFQASRFFGRRSNRDD